MKKKIICLLMTMVMFLSLFVRMDVSTLAETSVDGLTYEIDINQEVTIMGYSGFSKNLVIPETIDGCEVVSIGPYSFSSNTTLETVSIPESVRGIGPGAFYDCGSLKEINIPDGVQIINSGTFGRCFALQSISLPDSIYYIGNEAFVNCDSIVNISLPKELKEIGKDAFAYCDLLGEIILPKMMETLGDGAFRDCDSLVDIKVEEGNNFFSVEENVLFDKDKEEIVCYPKGKLCDAYSIPDGVTKIRGYAFYQASLSSVTIPESVAEIGEWAFYLCEKFTSINIPSKVIKINDYAFDGCTNVSEIILNNGVEHIGVRAFSGCNKVMNIEIPESVTSIGAGAFSNMDNLSRIDVNSNNMNYSSEDGALFNKEKTELVCYPTGRMNAIYNVPEGVTKLCEASFEGVENLIFVALPISLKTICADVGWTRNLWDNQARHVLYAGTEEQWNEVYHNSEYANGFKNASRCSLAGIQDITVNIVEPTCTSEGYTEYSCKCGYSCTGNETASLGHVGEVVEVVEPTCTSKGYTKYRCSRCTSEYKGDIVNTLGHDGEIVEIIAPTCVKWGYTKYGCSRCDYYEISDRTTKLGHDGTVVEVIEPTCITSGYTKYHCERCEVDYTGDSIATLGHTVGEFIKTVEPTCIELGYNEYSCSTCNQTIQQYIEGESTGHTFENNICVKCNRNAEECIESKHNYDNNCDETWSISKPGADYIIVRFSTATETGTGDYIYITMNGKTVKATGSQLAGKTLRAEGNEISIRLVSDSSDTAYGFAISEVRAYVGLSNSDIEVDLPIDDANKDVVLMVEEVCDTVSVELPDNQNISNAIIYDIYLESAGEIVQPEGEVTLRIPVAEDMVGEDCKVFHINASGDAEDMNAVYEDGYMVFTTDHFSYYALVELLKSILGDFDATGLVDSDDAIHLLCNTLFGEDMYPLNQNADVNGDGVIDSDDAVYLLCHTLFGEDMYPLH